jgi:predicted Kef-type K+ transport protein
VSFALGAFFAGRRAERVGVQPQARPPIRCRCRTPSRCCSSSRSACCSIRPSCYREPGAVLSVLALIMVGKSLIAASIIVLLRYPI